MITSIIDLLSREDNRKGSTPHSDGQDFERCRRAKFRSDRLGIWNQCHKTFGINAIRRRQRTLRIAWRASQQPQAVQTTAALPGCLARLCSYMADIAADMIIYGCADSRLVTSGELLQKVATPIELEEWHAPDIQALAEISFLIRPAMK